MNNNPKEDKFEESSTTDAQSESEKKEHTAEAEILDSLPPEAKKVMEMAISMQSISGRMPNPILSKLNEEHINKILDQSEKEEDNSFKDSQSNKLYNLIYFVLTIILIVFFVVYLADRDKDLLLNLADKALYILAGFGGGYGFKAFKDSKKTNYRS